VIDPAWGEEDFERLWAFVERFRLYQAGFTILTPLPGTAYFEEMRSRIGAREWAHFDMHHLLWEPALGPDRFFELYCETWRRSVLNLRGRKSVWQWMREVDPWNALFLLKALRRTQKMLDPQHYLAEYDLVPPARSIVTAQTASSIAGFTFTWSNDILLVSPLGNVINSDDTITVSRSIHNASVDNPSRICLRRGTIVTRHAPGRSGASTAVMSKWLRSCAGDLSAKYC
jgi:hypothetical protein